MLNGQSFLSLINEIKTSSFAVHEKEELFKAVCSVLAPDNFNERMRWYLGTAFGGDLHYSQEGEDIILSRIFSKWDSGFFVDVGAHHPVRYSNTYSLYQRGWNGINIDATPGVVEAFKLLRPRDRTLEIAIGSEKAMRTLYLFEQSALNTFNPELASKYRGLGFKDLGSTEVLSLPLREVLSTCLMPMQEIDLLCVDVEGDEQAVLSSIDWNIFRPKFLVVEILDSTISNFDNIPVVLYLRRNGYEPISLLYSSVIFKNVDPF